MCMYRFLLLIFISCTFFFLFRFIISGKGFRHEFGEIVVKVVGVIFGKNSGLHRRVQDLVGESTVVEAGTRNHTAALFQTQ